MSASRLGLIFATFDDASLQAGSVCDLEHRVDIVKVNLPKPKDLDRFEVQSREVDGCLVPAKQKVVIVFND